MAMTLQEAIDFAIAPPVPIPFGLEVFVTISMHDDDGMVLVGEANGLSAMFRPDLPLLSPGMATLAAPGATTATTGGSRFTKGPAPGFSTRGLGSALGAEAHMVVETGTNSGTTIPIDFSVRKDPGIPYLSFLSRWAPSVQIEIETLSAPAPGGIATGGIKLDPVEENGALLRAVGPSLQDATKRASYTATIFVHARIG